MIYLASPYTDRTNFVMENRYRMALEAVAVLINRGKLVYSPIVHFHPVAVVYDLPRDIMFWEEASRKMIECCDEFCVLEIEGHEASIGILREREYAASLDKPMTRLYESENEWHYG